MMNDGGALPYPSSYVTVGRASSRTCFSTKLGIPDTYIQKQKLYLHLHIHLFQCWLKVGSHLLSSCHGSPRLDAVSGLYYVKILPCSPRILRRRMIWYNRTWLIICFGEVGTSLLGDSACSYETKF